MTVQDIDTHNKSKNNPSTAQKKRDRNEYESQKTNMEKHLL